MKVRGQVEVKDNKKNVTFIGAVVTKMINVAIDVINCTLNTANMWTDKLYNSSASIYNH